MSNHRDGLYLEFSHDSSFSDNVCADNIRYGMHFMFSNNNSFHNNHYMRNQTGVAVMYSKNVHMTNNWFERKSSNAFYGMLLKEMTDSFIEGNIFIGNITGIYIDGSNRNQIKRNLFQTNGWAVQIYSNSTDNEFSENNFLSNQFDVITNTRRNNSKFFRNFWDRYRGYDLDRDSSGDVPYWPVSVFSSWVGDYHELSILLNSPVVKFLELAERIFPVLTPKELLDKNPSMKPFARLRHSETDPLLNANFIR
jgi:nitrous oxidase accessory protein